MIRLTDLLKEETKPVYEYGCVMLYFNPVKDFVSFQNNIKSEDLYTADDNGGYGLETEPHCTLLYGLHKEVELKTIVKIINDITFGKCLVHNPSLFENEKFDVLKLDVTYPSAPQFDGVEFLHTANKQLSKLPHTTSYPEYHPHMTIGYLKSGLGKKYVDELKTGVSAFVLKPTHIVYSQPDGTKTNIDINPNNI